MQHAQIALAWLLAQKPFIVPIPGTRNIDHLTENLGALDVALTPADLQEIDSDFAKITVHGARMDEANMRIVESAVCYWTTTDTRLQARDRLETREIEKWSY